MRSDVREHTRVSTLLFFFSFITNQSGTEGKKEGACVTTSPVENGMNACVIATRIHICDAHDQDVRAAEKVDRNLNTSYTTCDPGESFVKPVSLRQERESPRHTQSKREK